MAIMTFYTKGEIMELKTSLGANISLFQKPEMKQAFLILTLPLEELSTFLMHEQEQNPIFQLEEHTGNRLPEELFEELDLREDNYTHIEEIVFEEQEEAEPFEVPYQQTSYEELMKQFKEYTHDLQVIAEGEKIIGNLDKRGLISGKLLKGPALKIAHRIGVGFNSLREMFLYQLKDRKGSIEYELVKFRFPHLKKEECELLKKVLTCPLLIDAKDADPPTPIYDLLIDENSTVTVNEDPLPKLRLNFDYYHNPKMKKQAQDAKWILRNLKARFDFLRKIGQLLAAKRIPLNINECAEKLAIHPSTLYRAIKNKNISTPEGVFPLAHFFKKSKNIEERLAELIAYEEHPMSDEELFEVLSKEGFLVARRTISHYRKQLNIPSSRKRAK